MKQVWISSALMLITAALSAQTNEQAPEAPGQDTLERTVTITITEDGETYTIEMPNLASLAGLENLAGLQNLENLEDLEDLEGLSTLKYIDGAESGDVLEFEEFTVEIQADTIDSTSVTFGKWKVIVKEKGDGSDDVDFEIGRIDDTEAIDDFDFEREVDVFETDWFLFDLGYNTYVNKDFEFTEISGLGAQKAWGSWDVNLHMMRQRVNMFQGHMNLNWGLSFEWHNYMYRGDFYPVAEMDSFTITESATSLEKNRFSSTHFTLPLMLGFETKPYDTDNSFRIGFGYSPGLLVKGKTKIKDETGVTKVKDDYNLMQPFRHEVNVMLGYGGFNVYASYDVNSMFAEGQGPELYPVSIGLIINRGFDH